MADSNPIANTTAGAVRGLVENDILVFKGIRYGADTATTRFAAPKRPEPWAGVADALAYGNPALQPQGGDGGGLFTSWRPRGGPRPSEDCLFLNVWTPALADGKKRPVMVWLHGGGFVTGSGASHGYDGVRLAKRGDVVIVTINHRLNLFGYLYLGAYGEEFADSGNAGTLDTVLALEWVRDNAQAFGGDPGNVTIFGESGGGAKVSTLLTMEAAQGLFHRGVVQSGPMVMAMPLERARLHAEAVLEQLGLDAGSIGQIKTMPPTQLQEAVRSANAQLTAAGSITGGMLTEIASGPVLDGRALKQHPFHPTAAAPGKTVPMMIGANRTEHSLLMGARRPELFDVTWETLPIALAPWLSGYDGAAIISGYRRLHPSYGAPELFFALTTDRTFLRSSFVQADRKWEQEGAPVYFYLLDWNTPVDNGKWFCPHALDIGFVFDNVAKSLSMSADGPEQQRLADMMSESWLAFARTGNPNNALVPHWPDYDPKHRPVMVFGLEPKLVNDPRAAERALFAETPERVSA